MSIFRLKASGCHRMLLALPAGPGHAIISTQPI
jgi:hypothetical protein